MMGKRAQGGEWSLFLFFLFFFALLASFLASGDTE